MLNKLKLTQLFHQNVTFFHKYNNLVFLLANKEPQQQPPKEQTAKEIAKLKLKIVFFTLKGIHLLLLFVLPLSHFSRTLQYDMVSLHFGQANINNFCSALVLNFGYIIYYFHFHGPVANNVLLGEIVCGQKSGTFFIYAFKDKNKKSKNLQDTTVEEDIRRKLTLLYRRLQYFRATYQFLSIFVTLFIMHTLNNQTKGCSFGEKLLYSLILLLFGFFLNYNVDSCISIFSLVNCLGMTQLNVLMAKLRQICRYLREIGSSKTTFTSGQFTIFQKHYVGIFPYFAEYNALYGRIFVAYLVLNTPTNAYFVNTLFYNFDQLSTLGALYLSTYTLMQMSCLLFLHFFFTRFSTQFHAPSYLLHTVAVVGCMHRMGNVRLRLRMAGLISAFLNVRLYGITYDRFGLVTMRTFVKVSFKFLTIFFDYFLFFLYSF